MIDVHHRRTAMAVGEPERSIRRRTERRSVASIADAGETSTEMCALK